MSFYFITLIVFQSYSSFCVSMTFSKEEAVKGLKEVTKMLEEGYRVDSSALCLIEEFLKKFPLSPKSRNMSTFPPELFAKAANLVDLNLIQAIWSAVEQAPDLQLNKLSMKSMDLSTVSPQALEKVWDISNAALSPTQCTAIFPALLINPDIKEINLSAKKPTLLSQSTSSAPKWVPIWGPGSPWGPFSVFGSPKGPHFVYFRLKNALKVGASTTFYMLTI